MGLKQNQVPLTLKQLIDQKLQEDSLASLQGHPALQGAPVQQVLPVEQKALPLKDVTKPVEGSGISAGNALAAAQVVAGLLGGIMQSKQASKDRKAKAASEAATRSGEITMRGAQLKNAALESLMRKL